jgi:curli biogenesis system outer membrane secretion channel CsgG|tara:strand:- start:851 stop:1444 length:594 start_codon:yes stop_codon:yes gene_type:complete
VKKACIYVLLIICNTVFAQETIAVIDFSAEGVAQSDVTILTNRFRNALVMTGEAIVLERAQMDELLQESGFQQTGCVSEECAVEVGKMLGVQRIITGNIGRIGRRFTVDVRVIDVQSSRIVSVISRDSSGEIDNLLEVVEEMAFDMLGVKQKSNIGISKKWLWLGIGGTAVIGGIVYFLSQQEESSEGSVLLEIKLP